MFKIVKTPVIPTTVANMGDSFTAKINFVKADKNLSIYNKSNVIIYKKSDSTAQQWKFVRQSDGSYEITNVQYNQCLTVANNSSGEGANVQLSDDANAKGQRWFIYKISGGYILRPACSTTSVLDIYNVRICVKQVKVTDISGEKNLSGYSNLRQCGDRRCGLF